MDIINNNPYRQLGVFANSPTKERVANEGKLKAFLKVGRQVSFPLDLAKYLPPITRTINTPSEAEAKLTLPADQIKYAQFWFIKATSLDEVAFNHLFAGDMAKALEIWSKHTDAPSLQNRIVCCLIKNDYKTACTFAEYLYHRYSEQLVECITGVGSNVPKDLDLHFIDILCDEIGSKNTLNNVSDSNWKKHIALKSIAPIIARLQSAIDTAKATRGKGPTARYDAGVKLMNSTKGDLALLRTFLSTKDLQYQMIADKLGLEVLQCSIDYYNDTSESDAISKTMTLLEYAQSVVVGQMAKDRCKENQEALEKIERENSINRELNHIADSIKELREGISSDEIPGLILKPTTIAAVRRVVYDCLDDLRNVKGKLGKDNELYINISSALSSSAVNAIVTIINTEQRFHAYTNKFHAYTNKEELKNTVEQAMSLMRDIISKLDKNADASTYYSTTFSSLNNMYVNLHTTPSTNNDDDYYISINRSVGNNYGNSHSNSSTKSEDDGGYKFLTGCFVIILIIIGCMIGCNYCSGNKDTENNVSSTAVSDSIDVDSTAADSSYYDSSYTEPNAVNNKLNSVDGNNPYADNSLETGSKPYKQYYGKGITGQDYLQFKTSGDNDYVVIAKRHGSSKVVNHIYIRGGDTETMHLPDGNYDIYFYSGKGWDPEKDMGAVKGGFVDEAPVEKDENVSLYDQYGEYTLYPVQGGDLVLEQSDKQDMFN